MEALLPSHFREGRKDASSPFIFKSSGRWAGVADVRSTLEDGRGGGMRPNRGYQPNLVRGYSPSMHIFWRGDMYHYSPPLPFRRGRAGARACWRPASPRPCPAQGSWSCALAGGPAPRAGVMDMRAGQRARVYACGRACGRARWPAGMRQCLSRGTQAAVA